MSPPCILIKIIRRLDNDNSTTEISRFGKDLLEMTDVHIHKGDIINLGKDDSFRVDRIEHQIVPRRTILYEHKDVHYRSLWHPDYEEGLKKFLIEKGWKRFPDKR